MSVQRSDRAVSRQLRDASEAGAGGQERPGSRDASTPRPRRARRSSLWRWISVRVVGMVLVAQAIQLAVGTWQNYWWEEQLYQSLTPELQAEMFALQDALDENPDGDSSRLQEIYREYLLPDMVRVGSEAGQYGWGWYAGLTLASLTPVILACLWFSRRLSRQLGAVAASAGRIAQGEFGSRAEAVRGAPPALQALTEDFNQMAERLERFDQELQVSSAAIAHELRTPLTAAKGRLQGVIDGVFPAQPQHFQLIMRQVDQMDRLVDDLYLLSLASADQLVLSPGDFYLHELVEERCAWAAPALAAAGMRLEVEVAADLLVHADRERVGQVVSCLLDNALRYAAGGGWLRVAASETKAMATLLVEDAGQGFPEKYIDRVCDRFWRAEHSRARHKGGSGLGLAVATAICRAHGGSLQVSNRPEGGGRITIQLPL